MALVIIAGGTSLPDLYASRSAAIGDPTADAAIGNVMGSNAVNVFLGLGLPWTVAAIYWETVGVTEEWTQRVGDDFPQLPCLDGGWHQPHLLHNILGTSLRCLSKKNTEKNNGIVLRKKK